MTQEPSSQTSLANNRDPQTPSPLYSKALANHINVAQATETNGFNTKSVNPHFAHPLISMLTSLPQYHLQLAKYLVYLPLAQAI